MNKSFIDSVCEIYSEFRDLTDNDAEYLEMREKYGEVTGWLECGRSMGIVSECGDLVEMLDDVYLGEEDHNEDEFRKKLEEVSFSNKHSRGIFMILKKDIDALIRFKKIRKMNKHDLDRLTVDTDYLVEIGKADAYYNIGLIPKHTYFWLKQSISMFFNEGIWKRSDEEVMEYRRVSLYHILRALEPKFTESIREEYEWIFPKRKSYSALSNEK